MFKKIIKFSAPQEYFDLKEDHPTPIKNNVPNWYKKLKHTFFEKTVKGCMPFLDTLTSGYLLKIPQDIVVKHNVLNEKNVLDSYQFVDPLDVVLMQTKQINLIFEHKAAHHPIRQMEGSPLVEKNKGLSFHKIINPWTITTPPGYSCLFLPPMNNQDDRFSILPGIVDTDKFYQEVNFPIVFNCDKYETLDTILKKGTPYVQVIPFKRESWKMKVTPQKKLNVKKLWHNLSVLDKYKNLSWVKKTWT
jgi:hypothetical protein